MSIRLQFIYHEYKAFSIVIGFVLCVGLPFMNTNNPSNEHNVELIVYRQMIYYEELIWMTSKLLL